MSPDTRLAILQALVRYSAPLEQIAQALESLPVDCEAVDAVELSHLDAAKVLDRYVAGRLHPSDVQTWAKLIEPRGDIRYPARDAEPLAKLMFRLANQDVSEKLTKVTAADWALAMKQIAQAARSPKLTDIPSQSR